MVNLENRDLQRLFDIHDRVMAGEQPTEEEIKFVSAMAEMIVSVLKPVFEAFALAAALVVERFNAVWEALPPETRKAIELASGGSKPERAAFLQSPEIGQLNAEIRTNLFSAQKSIMDDPSLRIGQGGVVTHVNIPSTAESMASAVSNDERAILRRMGEQRYGR